MDRLKRCTIDPAALLLAIVAAVALALVWYPSPALADDTALGGIAGDWYPLTSTDIRMESETVQAVCYRNFAEYRADFLFVNSGQSQTVMLGFPFAVNPEGESTGGLIGFRAWQDGRPLAVTLGNGPDMWHQYFLHKAVFPVGETVISVAYMANPTVTAGERFPELKPPQFAAVKGMIGADSKYDYWLHTGAGWAGTIGTAVIRFTLADDFRGYGLDVVSGYQSPEGFSGYLTRPETYTKLGANTYQWVFEDLEPTEADDVQLGFSALVWWDESASLPPAMGPVVTSVTTSNPTVPTTNPWDDPLWPLLDGSPGSALGLTGPHPWITLGIQGDIGEIRIVPGNNETLETFSRCSRPKTVRITLSDGSNTTVTLADEPSLQKLAVSGVADWVRLDVIDSYPGTGSADVYIGDVSFGSGPSPAFEPFDALLAAGKAGGPPQTSAPPATGAGSPTVTVPETVPPSANAAAPAAPTEPVTSLLSGGIGTDPAPSGTRDGMAIGTLPIVLFAVAGVAFVAAVVMTVILLRRRGAAR